MSLRRIFWPACAVLLMATAVGLFVGNRDAESPTTASTPTRPSSPSPTVNADSASTVLSAKDRSALNGQVKAFSALYFSLSPARSSEQVRQSVRQYATRSFLDNARFGLGSSEADLAMRRSGAYTEAKAVSGIVGPVMDRRTVLGTVTLRITEYTSDGDAVTSFERQQEMKWVKQNDTWLILEAH